MLNYEAIAHDASALLKQAVAREGRSKREEGRHASGPPIVTRDASSFQRKAMSPGSKAGNAAGSVEPTASDHFDGMRIDFGIAGERELSPRDAVHVIAMGHALLTLCEGPLDLSEDDILTIGTAVAMCSEAREHVMEFARPRFDDDCRAVRSLCEDAYDRSRR